MAGFIGQNADVDATAEQLVAVSTPIQYQITIRANPANTGDVAVGLSNAVTTSTGFLLDAGDVMTLSVAEVADASSIWVIGSGADQGVSYHGV